jgi:hypothetical protein
MRRLLLWGLRNSRGGICILVAWFCFVYDFLFLLRWVGIIFVTILFYNPCWILYLLNSKYCYSSKQVNEGDATTTVLCWMQSLDTTSAHVLVTV